MHWSNIQGDHHLMSGGALRRTGCWWWGLTGTLCLALGASMTMAQVRRATLTLGSHFVSSGVGALLELARALHQADCVPEFTIVIVAFDLEESGSEGSQQFIQAGPVLTQHLSQHHHPIFAGVSPASPADPAWPRRIPGSEVTVCRGHHHGLPPGPRHGGGLPGQQSDHM